MLEHQMHLWLKKLDSNVEKKKLAVKKKRVSKCGCLSKSKYS
jgi:hypothetical protein